MSPARSELPVDTSQITKLTQLACLTAEKATAGTADGIAGARQHARTGQRTGSFRLGRCRPGGVSASPDSDSALKNVTVAFDLMFFFYRLHSLFLYILRNTANYYFIFSLVTRHRCTARGSPPAGGTSAGLHQGRRRQCFPTRLRGPKKRC